MIASIGLGLYALCVDFMIRIANLFDITYRDANALLFFVVWPAVTALLAVLCVRQRRTLARLRADPRAPRRGARS